jgi:hypothetical protein
LAIGYLGCGLPGWYAQAKVPMTIYLDHNVEHTWSETGVTKSVDAPPV